MALYTSYDLWFGLGIHDLIYKLWLLSGLSIQGFFIYKL